MTGSDRMDVTRMLHKGELLLCAVSGGKDSMALLHWAKAQAEKQGFSLMAAHFHHGIRGEEADGDAKFVEEICRQWKIPCVVGKGDVPQLARKNGWSLEEAARRARYSFLEETAQQVGAKRIALAHHEEDNAETILLNLIRGTGPAGLTGMKTERGMLYRPFLSWTNEDILRYLEEHQIPYREDSSNADMTYARNYLRNEVFPRLCQTNAQAIRHIASAGKKIQALQEFAEQKLDHMGKKDPDGSLSVSFRELDTLSEGLWPMLFLHLLRKLDAGMKDVNEEQLTMLTHAVHAGKGHISLPNHMYGEARDGGLVFSKTKEDPTGYPLRWEIPVSWNQKTILLTKVLPKEEKDSFTIPFFCDKMEDRISLDRWTGRDRLYLQGNRGPRTVKRLLMERIPSVDERSRIPVVRYQDELLGVCCLGVDKKFATEGREPTGYIVFYNKTRGTEQ